jgi:hypothetical protein
VVLEWPLATIAIVLATTASVEVLISASHVPHPLNMSVARSSVLSPSLGEHAQIRQEAALPLLFLSIMFLKLIK